MQPIKIQVEESYIPVDILGDVYKFWQTDEDIINFEKCIKNIQEELDSLNTTKNHSLPVSKQFSKAHEVLESGFEFLFRGQDAYTRLKTKIDSTRVLLNVFTQVMVQLTDELNTRKKGVQHKRAEQYVTNKKKRTKNNSSNRG